MLTIMGWNINQRSNHSGKDKIPDFILKAIEEQKADIIVLTEFFKAKGYEEFISKLENFGYRASLDPREPEKNKNQIMIAVSEKLDISNGVNIKTLPNDIESNYPNFLQITVKYKGKPLTIIGTRMRDMEKASQFKELNDHIVNIPKEHKIICIGDFNAFHKFCVDHLPFSNEEISPNWCQHQEEYSYVHKNGDKVQIDHIAVKGITVSNENNEKYYNWNFIDKDNGYCDLKQQDYKSFKESLPDHAILFANLD